MLLLLAAMTLVSDDVAVRAEEWARKAKPFAECSDQASCDRKWAAAKKWVTDNTRFKIAVDKRDIFSTPGAIYANTDLSFTLTRRSNGEGATLSVYAWCGNVISCKPKPRTAIAALTRAVEDQ